MSKIRSTNTKPEIQLRKLIYSLGFRYRIHYKKLPGTPDLAFIGKKKAIFLHGCFWHQHDNCKRSSLPKSRVKYWHSKLAKNKSRDKDNILKLNKMGWDVLVIWECELKDSQALKKRITEFLSPEK